MQVSNQSLVASLSISFRGAYRSSCQSHACLPGAGWRRRSDDVAARYSYPRRARSALGVDTVLTLDVCLYVC